MKQNKGRRLVRERVLQILYAFEMTKDNLNVLIESNLADILNNEDREFANSIIFKILKNKEYIDELIQGRIDNWEMDRVTIIDKILLRMAISEMLYFEDIPPKVSMNEVIDIAKEYSTAGSGKFINGILDVVLAHLKTNNLIVKTGRGLLDESVSSLEKKSKKNDKSKE